MVEFSKPPLLLITPGQEHLSADGLSVFVLHSLSEPICFRHSNSHSLGLIFAVIQGSFFWWTSPLWCPHSKLVLASPPVFGAFFGSDLYLHTHSSQIAVLISSAVLPYLTHPDGPLSVKWGPSLVDFFMANTWYHFIYPCPSRALEQRGHQSGPHGLQGRLWWGEMMPHIGASAMTLPAPDPCDLISPSPQLLAPIGLRWTLVLEWTESVGGGEQQKVNWWSEGFYWDWEVEREGERMC